MWETVALAIQLLGWIGVPITLVALVRIAMRMVKVSKAVKPIVRTATVGMLRLLVVAEKAKAKTVLGMVSLAVTLTMEQCVMVTKAEGKRARVAQALKAMIVVPIVLAYLLARLPIALLGLEVAKAKTLAKLAKETARAIGIATAMSDALPRIREDRNLYRFWTAR